MQANRVQSGQSYASRRIDPNDLKPKNRAGDISLHLLVKSRDVKGLEAKIHNSGRTGADLREFVNYQNKNGDTPLHHAVQIHSKYYVSGLRICRLLLANHADPNIRNRLNQIPSLVTRSEEMWALLSEYGGAVPVFNANFVDTKYVDINARKAAEAKAEEARQMRMQLNPWYNC